MQDSKKRINDNLCRIQYQDPLFAKEMNLVGELYEFYEGTPEDYTKALTDPNETFGQLWQVKADKYMPTRDIRNLTRKLIQKQTRFFLSVPPTLMMKPLESSQVEQAESKRVFIDNIFEDNHFWNKSKNAFTDCVIGKRVLLAVLLDVPENTEVIPLIDDRTIKLKYYTSPEFIYELNPHNDNELQKVVIVYPDEKTVGLLDTEQRWYRWTYEKQPEMKTCIATFELLDGNGSSVVSVDGNTGSETIIKKTWDTQLEEIPCRLILNDKSTGDTRGRSDLLDLVYLAINYNKTVSDYRDALRFKMFEQPVFINCDDNSIANIEISPGSAINLKPDMAYADENGRPVAPQATTLGSQFNFVEGTKTYLEGLKKDMYEIMEQPLPEQIQNVPSGKALEMLYYDLISRCEDKWTEWDSAIKWAIDMILFMTEKFGLYMDREERNAIHTETLLTIDHNYPIPSDEEAKKEIAIKEVDANVKSKLTYIKEYGNVEDEQAEWQQIMDEMDAVNQSMNAGLMETNTGFDDEDEDNKQNKSSKEEDKEDK